jgi:hypothetical protein
MVLNEVLRKQVVTGTDSSGEQVIKTGTVYLIIRRQRSVI